MSLDRLFTHNAPSDGLLLDSGATETVAGKTVTVEDVTEQQPLRNHDLDSSSSLHSWDVLSPTDTSGTFVLSCESPRGGIFAAGSLFSSHPDSYHQVFTIIRGIKHYGLLVDPGAAKGLIGEATLAEIKTNMLQPLGMANSIK